MSASYVRTSALMGTVVSMQVVEHGASQRARRERTLGVDRAFTWFRRVESVCSRFDATSEVRQLCNTVETPVRVSPLLFQAVQFALAVAEETSGAFDPTIGARLEARGFDRDYRTGARAHTGVVAVADVSYQDVSLDASAQTILLHRPLLLDLGAVAKGLAVDMAARELSPFVNFAIDAGGDLYLGGRNSDDALWSVGIRHPRDAATCIDTLQVTDCAVCTSGDYERVGVASGEHHLMDPRSDATSALSASATVIAASAMVADALATAAFVLGPVDGIALLERHQVRGFLVTPLLERFDAHVAPDVVPA